MPSVDATTRAKINELRQEVDQEWAFERRKEYLADRMADLVVDWWYERTNHSRHVAKGQMLDDMLCQDKMRKLLNEFTRYQNELYYRRLSMQGQQVGVTADEVRQAKQHPFEDLLPVVRGKVCCPFHEDKNPSASIKNNKLHCFVCNKTWDTIDFWMEKNGGSFSDAVRSLC